MHLRFCYTYIIYIAGIVAMLGWQGCDVHEFPGDDVSPPEPPPAVEHTLTLTFDDNDFDFLQDITVGSDQTKSRVHASSSGHNMRYIVRAYKIETQPQASSRVPSRAVIDYYEGVMGDDGAHPDFTLPLDLEAGEYDLLAWAEHIPVGQYSDYYYNTKDFYELTFNNIGTSGYQHSGNNTYRQAWRGATHFNIDRDGVLTVTDDVVQDADMKQDGDEKQDGEAKDVLVTMSRPMARYHFVTTDLDEFISRVKNTAKGDSPSDAPPMGVPESPNLDDYRVVIRYTGYMPSAYNLLSDKPIDSTTGIKYEGSIDPIDDKQAQLGYDYVLVNGSSTSVQVALDLYRKSDNELLSSTGVISVPLKRGHYTVIKGPLLTTMAGAGVGISPGFNGDYNIEIH